MLADSWEFNSKRHASQSYHRSYSDGVMDTVRETTPIQFLKENHVSGSIVL